jgi:hypothetical protein
VIHSYPWQEFRDRIFILVCAICLAEEVYTPRGDENVHARDESPERLEGRRDACGGVCICVILHLFNVQPVDPLAEIELHGGDPDRGCGQAEACLRLMEEEGGAQGEEKRCDSERSAEAAAAFPAQLLLDDVHVEWYPQQTCGEGEEGDLPQRPRARRRLRTDKQVVGERALRRPPRRWPSQRGCCKSRLGGGWAVVV